MTFGEKIRAGRLARGWSQGDLAETTGLSLRTIQHYEGGATRPKKAETYLLLARALGIPEEILRDDGEDLKPDGKDMDALRAAREARRLAAEVRVLYAGGDLCEEDMDAMMRALEDAYRVAKERQRGAFPASGEGESDGQS